MSIDLPPEGGSYKSGGDKRGGDKSGGDRTGSVRGSGGTYALAITGASGALYAVRTMAALLERDCHLEVVVSDYGRRLLHDELGEAASVNRLREYLVEKYGEPASRGRVDTSRP